MNIMIYSLRITDAMGGAEEAEYFETEGRRARCCVFNEFQNNL